MFLKNAYVTVTFHLHLKRLSLIDVTFAFLVDTLHVKCVQFFIHMLANIGYKKSFDKLDIILIGVNHLHS